MVDYFFQKNSQFQVRKSGMKGWKISTFDKINFRGKEHEGFKNYIESTDGL